MIDESVAQNLQAQVIRGDPGAMAKLYAECRHLGGIIIGNNSPLNGSRDEIIHAAVSRILGRYKNGYRVRSFSRMLKLEILHQAESSGPKAAFYASVQPMGEEEIPSPPAANTQLQVSTLEDTLQEPHGKEIIFDLRLYHDFKDALLAVAGYVSPWRLSTEAPKLKEIHRVMHGKSKDHGKPRRGNMVRDAAPDPGHQRRPTEGKQAHPLQSRDKNAHRLE